MVGKFWACLGAVFCLLFVRPQAPSEPPLELRGFGQRSVEDAAGMFQAASPKPDPGASRFFRFARAPKFAGVLITAPHHGAARLMESFLLSLQSRLLEPGRGFSFSRLQAAETAREPGPAPGGPLMSGLFRPSAETARAGLAGKTKTIFNGFEKFKFETLKASRIVRAP